jgi:F420-dependent oxidoreductase-like protein
MELRLPAPCVVVLIGASGSGKTTWTQAHFAANEVVSSDALRATVGIDEDDMAASSVAFELLEKIVAERIRRNLTTVIDTTGLEPDRRVAWVAAAHDAGLPVYAILFDADIETIDPANRRKTHPVPKSVLRKQLSKFDRASQEVEDEGFDAIHHRQPVRVVTSTLTAPDPVKTPDDGHSFGLLVSRFDWATEELGDQLAKIAWRAEDAGFTDLWVMDHFRQIRGVGRPWEDIPEAFTALSYVAGVTTRIRLGCLVSGITHRHPVVLGKMMATLDVLSGGRAICGLGAAWDQEEHAAYGIEMPSVSARYDLLEDTLEMLPLLWGKGTPSFEGKTLTASELICYPRPIQDPIPILIGGSGEKKTLRLVAQYADASNLFGSPDTVRRKVEVLKGHCEAVGRDPAEVVVTHLANAMVGTDPAGLRERINQVRGRNTSVEDFSKRNNAGMVPDLVNLFAAYAGAGAQHSIVAMPDVNLEGSIESFGEVISAFDRSL